MIISGVTKIYKTKKTPSVKALDDITVDLPDSGMVFFLGKSGCGKTTLLNVLGGLDKADSGKIIIDGKDICTATEKELRSYRNEYCGFVFQDFNLVSELNISENITLALDIKHDNYSEEELKEVLEEIELSGLQDRKINELSGGQKQRVAIARALIKKPKIILADEPTGALDSQTGENIFKLLKKISQNRLVLVVSHDRDFAQKYGDRTIELSDGKIISDTDKSYSSQQTDGVFNVTSADLPLKTAFKIGVNSVKLHPIRFLMMILISVLSFSFLATALTGVFTNKTDIFINEVEKNKVYSTAVYKCDVVTDDSVTSLDDVLGAKTKYYNPTDISQPEIDELKSITNLSVISSLNLDVISFQKSYANLTPEKWPTDGKHYGVKVYGYINMTQADCDTLGFGIFGRLPENEGEVAIPECLYNSFNLLGIKEEGNSYEIQSKNDIIGKKIPLTFDTTSREVYKTIVGIIDSGCYKDLTTQSHPNKNFFDCSLCEKIFVHSDCIDSYSCAIVPTSDNPHELKKLVNFVFKSETDTFAYRLSNGISGDFYRSLNFHTMMKNLFTYLGIIFVVLSVLLLVNFVTVSIQNQLKEIGILSALGVGTGGIFKIYLSVLSGFGLIIFGLSYGVSFIWNSIVNSLMLYNATLEMFIFNIFSPLLLFAIIAITIAVGTVIPVLLIKRKSPAEIIHKGSLA